MLAACQKLLNTANADMWFLPSKAIEEALLDFFENSKENEYSTEVKKAKEKFSWTNFSKAIIELYRHCTSDGKK